ncbi:hypothetical protein [Microbulbifer sp. TYP-18]|uniref:hypothetical protein n=1 Tax=Microbulbifer sp. TYP-18 TaxID=3230024 RepID=UPI0034C5D0DD
MKPFPDRRPKFTNLMKVAVMGASVLPLPAVDGLGEKITRINDLRPDDLVFLKNTYGNWTEVVLTHAGIALGDSTYIHRLTSNDGVVGIQPIPADVFLLGNQN